MKNPFENIYVGVIADNFPIFSFFIREKNRTTSLNEPTVYRTNG